MLTWEKENYGLRFTFADPLTLEETEQWRDAVRALVPELSEGFGVFVDMRQMELIPPVCKPIIEEIQIFCKRNGLGRSVLILAEELTALQLKVIASRTGVREWERYIIASKTADWERIGVDWLVNAVEPESRVQQPIP